MKKAIFVFTVFVMLFGIKIIEKKRSMELMVYEMYLDNFEEYLTFDENLDIKKKRIEIRKLKRKRLSERHVKMFLKLLDYIAEF